MPMYDFFCPACKKEMLDEYRALGCPLTFPCACGGNFEVKIGAPSAILVPPGGRKACRVCKMRDRMNGTYAQGGCEGGKTCRGFSPADVSAAKKKISAQEMAMRRRMKR